MTVRNIAAAHVCCDHQPPDDGRRCHAVIVAGPVTTDEARAAATLRGWRCDDTGDRCPSHVGSGGAS